MTSLRVSRDIDVICYNDFIYNPFWAGILNYLSDKEIKTVVDIGASSGISALWILDRLNVDRYYCFEPDPENFNMLLENTRPFGDKIIPYNYGIYYGTKESEVFGIGDNSPLGYTIQGAMERDNTEHKFIKYEGKIFKLMELEDMMFASPADLIKIDVEGSEYNIIENSTYLKLARYLLIAFHNNTHDYVRNIIKENLKQFSIINFGEDGCVYSNVLLERNVDRWLQLSFLKTGLEQTNSE